MTDTRPPAPPEPSPPTRRVSVLREAGMEQPPPEIKGSLPSYTGDETSCPKCNYRHASTLWQSAKRHPGFNRNLDSPEYLERKCSRCLYVWDEAVPDGAN